MAPGFSSPNDALDDIPNEINEVIDEEELAHLRELKELKKHYRTAYKELKDSKTESNFNQQAIDSLKQKLISCFEEWYSDTFEEVTLEATKTSKTQPTRSAMGHVEPSPAKVSKTDRVVLTEFV